MTKTPDSARAAAIARRYESLRAEVARAAERAGRRPEDVLVIGVTKTVDVDDAAALRAAGCRDFGENRPEELLRKAAAPALADVRWHLIGKFQRRKVRDALPACAFVHSVDSTSLLEAIAKRAATLAPDAARRPRLLLEINVSGEPAKSGFAPADAAAALEAAVAAGLEPAGFMTMAPLDPSYGTPAATFRALRELRDRLASPRLPLRELSMGMSGDFREAIAEGATMVRVGTALFPPPGA